VGVTNYLVERCQGAGCSSFAQIATPTGTSLSDTGLSPGTTYSYRVRATDAAGNLGPYSSTATATTTAPDTTPPSAPSGLTATAAGSSQINLAWTAATDNVGVSSYLVERCQGAGCSSFAQIGTSTATSFSSTGLTAGTSYSFRVRAQDAAGNTGAYSGTASATTTTVPTNPTFVQGTFTCPSTSQTAVTVAYTAAQAAGDLNVVIVGWSNSTSTITSVTDTAGNTYTLAVGPTTASNQASQSIYYARNIAAAAAGNAVTVRFGTAAPFVDLRIAQYHGLDTAAPLDVTATGTANSGTTASTSSATTTAAVELVVAGDYVATSTRTAGTGFTSRMITAPDGDNLEDRVTSATGAVSGSAALSGSGWWIMQMATFKAR
jgi:hypothetical protein